MKKDSIIKIIFVILIFAIIALVAIYIAKLNTNSLEEHKFYQYFGGIKVDYQGALEISKKNTGITNLKLKDKEIELDSTPIYYEDIENRVLFPEDMAIVFPQRQGLMQKITHFTTAELEEGVPYLKFEKNISSIENAFLFDGRDLYFFFDNTTLNIDGKKYELSPLSYVIVTYKQAVEIYQKEEDNYKIIETNSGKVTAKTSEYEINLSTDALTTEGKEQLLLKKIDILPNYNWK